MTTQAPPSTIEVNLFLPVNFSTRADLELTDMGYVVRLWIVGRGVSRRIKAGRAGLDVAEVVVDGRTKQSCEAFGPLKAVSEVISLSVQLYSGGGRANPRFSTIGAGSSKAELMGEEGSEMNSMAGVVRRGEFDSSEIMDVQDSRRVYSRDGRAGDEGRRGAELRDEDEPEDAERLSKEGGVRAGNSRGAK